MISIISFVAHFWPNSGWQFWLTILRISDDSCFKKGLTIGNHNNFNEVIMIHPWRKMLQPMPGTVYHRQTLKDDITVEHPNKWSSCFFPVLSMTIICSYQWFYFFIKKSAGTWRCRALFRAGAAGGCRGGCSHGGRGRGGVGDTQGLAQLFRFAAQPVLLLAQRPETPGTQPTAGQLGARVIRVPLGCAPRVSQAMVTLDLAGSWINHLWLGLWWLKVESCGNETISKFGGNLTLWMIHRFIVINVVICSYSKYSYYKWKLNANNTSMIKI